MKKLGVNIDHVATVRNARRGIYPRPVEAALAAQIAGADSITIHLREDRRHIKDSDLPEIQKACRIPINLEMALHADIIKIALKQRPEKVCIVPEKRQEVTTEGGLDLFPSETKLRKLIPEFQKRKIEVSLFIDPDPKQIQLAARLKTNAIEIHTGTYADASGARKKKELERIKKAAKLAWGLGLKVNAGHGLDYRNVKPIASIPQIEELNIGFSIVSKALFVGLPAAVKMMKDLLKNDYRTANRGLRTVSGVSLDHAVR